MATYCSSCGAALIGEGKFCAKCGAKTPVVAQDSVSDSQPSAAVQSQPAQSAPVINSVVVPGVNGGRIAAALIWRIFMVIAGFILLPCVGLYFDMYKSNAEWTMTIMRSGPVNEGVEFAAAVFAGTPYVILICVLLVFASALSKNFAPFIPAWVVMFFLPEFYQMFNEICWQNAYDSFPALCMYRATIYGSLMSETRGSCIAAAVVLVIALIVQFVEAYFADRPQRGWFRLVARNKQATSAAAPAAAGGSAPVPVPVPTASQNSMLNKLSAINEAEKVSSAPTWDCPFCGCRNPNTAGECKSCGRYKTT